MKYQEKIIKKADKKIRKLNCKLMKKEFSLYKLPSEEELKTKIVRKIGVIFFLQLVFIMPVPILLVVLGAHFGIPVVGLFVGISSFVIDIATIPFTSDFITTISDKQEKIFEEREKILLELEKYKQIKKTYDYNATKTSQQEKSAENGKKGSMYNYIYIPSIKYKGWNTNIPNVDEKDDEIISNEVKVRKKCK